ncbi:MULTISPECIES: DUF4365 domain-containing protein [unclassified Microcoleus]|uniref:DUF4365 domain-containing protein n=1 Tax=unclassified Microcoleus TaxID=2642155 RepID=UPI002FD01022
MELNQRKELFSKAYVRAVAAVAGCSVDQPENDYDSVDLCIKAIGSDPMQPHRLELQLKCTSRDVLDAESVRYPLNVKNYNDLRVTAFIPRLLVVVLVPENIGEWIQQSEQEMLLRHCAYWVSLRGMPETRNTNRITVELPRRNHFTPQALESIMQRISKGGFP